MTPPNLRRSLITLFFTLFAGYIIVLIASLVAILIFNHFEEKHVAHTLAVSVRNEIITGDFRSAIIALNQSVPSEFSNILYVDRDGTKVFNVPSDLHRSLFNSNNLNDESIEPISVSSDLQPMGNLVFYFSRTRGMSIATSVWFLFLFLSIPFIKRARNQMLEQYRKDLETQQSIALAQLASQVAHDIRSPLAALNMASKSLGVLPEDTQILLRGAITRISDIASQLLRKNEGDLSSLKPTATGPVVLLLSALLDVIVSEKRLEFRSRVDLGIENELNTASYGVFVRADSVELKRIISNLINNAAEATFNGGRISLSAMELDSSVELRIQDRGRGMPPEILSKLGNRGETYGKLGGSGLGLFHARKSMESWDGDIVIRSELGAGTCVTLVFPKVSAPAWFTSFLHLNKNAPVIIVDDDSSIHRIWKKKIEDSGSVHNGIEIFHFSEPQSFSLWLRKNARDSAATFLVDYEFSGHAVNGLDLIAQLGISKSAILVTSRYEDSQILERCERLGVRLIPKAMAVWVPVQL